MSSCDTYPTNRFRAIFARVWREPCGGLKQTPKGSSTWTMCSGHFSSIAVTSPYAAPKIWKCLCRTSAECDLLSKSRSRTIHHRSERSHWEHLFQYQLIRHDTFRKSKFKDFQGPCLFPRTFQALKIWKNSRTRIPARALDQWAQQIDDPDNNEHGCSLVNTSQEIQHIRSNSCLSEAQSVYALTANLRIGNTRRFLSSFADRMLSSCFVRARRMARVFFGRRSFGTCRRFWYHLRRFSFCVWLMTVRIRAIDFRTIRLHKTTPCFFSITYIQ